MIHLSRMTCLLWKSCLMLTLLDLAKVVAAFTALRIKTLLRSSSPSQLLSSRQEWVDIVWWWWELTSRRDQLMNKNLFVLPFLFLRAEQRIGRRNKQWNTISKKRCRMYQRLIRANFLVWCVTKEKEGVYWSLDLIRNLLLGFEFNSYVSLYDGGTSRGRDSFIWAFTKDGKMFMKRRWKKRLLYTRCCVGVKKTKSKSGSHFIPKNKKSHLECDSEK